MRYSIIIPHCHGVSESAKQIHELETALARSQYELLSKFSGCPTIEHAVVAGLRASKGEAIVVLEPGERYPPTQVPALLRTLSRADFVCGRPRRRGWPKLKERLARVPQWLFLGAGARDPHSLFWAARREVLNGLPLTPRFVRYLPSFVARQGFRVDSIYLDEREASRTAAISTLVAAQNAPHSGSASLLSAWWAFRRLNQAERANATARRQEERASPVLGNAVSTDRYRSKSA
jgi:hypothetical protein